ncbi:unnamed protein product [Calypogeia fissa]
MGRLFLEYFEGKAYSCQGCHTHLAKRDDLVSRSFRSHHGKAYLFNSVVNVLRGPPEERQMNTGLHVVNDVICKACDRVLGWRYEVAHEESQKYKEGMFILERRKVDYGDWSGLEEISGVPRSVDSDGEQS